MKKQHILKSTKNHFRSFHNRRSFIINCQLLIVNLFLLLSCSSPKEKTTEEDNSVPLSNTDVVAEVSAMQLDYTDFNYELVSNGNISAIRKADLRFQSGENIRHIYVKNGDQVVQGQKIAELEPFKLKSAMEQSKDNLEKSILELQDILIGQGYALKDSANVPTDIMKIAKIKSNYDQNTIQYEVARYNLKMATLYAPFNGAVANLTSKEHNLANPSDAFCCIIDNRHPEVIFMVLENELPLIKPGEKVLVSPFSINDYICEGKITEINPAIDKNGMVRVKASVENVSGKLYDGMNVNVRVQRELGKQLVIPKEALVLRNDRKVVFTLKNGTAQWVYVQTGPENSKSYVVTEGLSPGDSLIYKGNFNLAHETPVQLTIEN